MNIADYLIDTTKGGTLTVGLALLGVRLVTWIQWTHTGCHQLLVF
jgi:hypothetical protein